MKSNRLRLLAALACTAAIRVGVAAQSAALPEWACNQPDTLFATGFESGDAAVPQTPSLGSGGAYPGDVTRTIDVDGATRTFYLYLPADYQAGHAWPLLLALHGQSGSAATAPAAAQQVRSDWSSWADAGGFIVLAPIGTQSLGGWDPSVDVPSMDVALNDTYARYNVDRGRIYLWGFSAGAHLAHALALNNTDYFAAYGISAGSLTQYACSDDGSFWPTCDQLLGGVTRDIPVDIHLGDADPLYTLYGAGGDPLLFENHGWILNQNLHYTLFSGGHTYSIAQLGEIWGDLCRNAIIP